MNEKCERNYKNKSYCVGVWDISYYLVDMEGRMLTNKDGSVKVFYSNNVDCSYWADGIDPDDLIEMEG